MRKDTIFPLLSILLLLSTLFIFTEYTTAASLSADDLGSPLHHFFSYKKILWTFDDYMIQYDHHPPHKGFYGLPMRIADYGGHVNIMVIFTDHYYASKIGNEIRNVSVIDEFGISPDHINKSLAFFHHPHIYAQCHGWANSVELNKITLADAYHLINHTLWNWDNNYGIHPHFFLGHSKNGNYNITLALQRFSDTYWPMYGENIRWYDPGLFPTVSPEAPAIDFVLQSNHATEIDPLFGCDWGAPCETLADAKTLFETYSQDKEVILIRGHPDFLNNTDTHSQQALSMWESWIDWIFSEHDIINMNHTKAIHYNKDRHHFNVSKKHQDTFIIDLSNCSYDHQVLFTQPYQEEYYNWTLIDEKDNCIGIIYNDTYLDVQAGHVYTFRAFDMPQGEDTQTSLENSSQATPGFPLISLALAGYIVILFYRKHH